MHLPISQSKHTPILLLASRRGYSKMCEALLDAGADVNLGNKVRGGGEVRPTLCPISDALDCVRALACTLRFADKEPSCNVSVLMEMPTKHVLLLDVDSLCRPSLNQLMSSNGFVNANLTRSLLLPTPAPLIGSNLPCKHFQLESVPSPSHCRTI